MHDITQHNIIVEDPMYGLACSLYKDELYVLVEYRYLLMIHSAVLDVKKILIPNQSWAVSYEIASLKTVDEKKHLTI